MAKNFDLENEIQNLEISNMLKNGFLVYIQNNNVDIKSKKDLLNKLNEFKETNIGGV